VSTNIRLEKWEEASDDHDFFSCLTNPLVN